jgi:uncharacterized membrane protein YqjE
MRRDAPDGRRAIGTLVRDLLDEGTSLVRSEARLAKLELSRAAAAIGRGTAFVALGAVLVMLGGLALVVALILIMGDQWLPADRYWLAALIIMAATGIIAALFAKRGRSQVALARLGPAETAMSVKENATWVKQQLTSDGRSR